MFRIKLKKEQNKLKPFLTNCKQYEEVGNKFLACRYKTSFCSSIQQPSLQVCSLKKTLNFSSANKNKEPRFLKKSLRSMGAIGPCLLFNIQWFQKPYLNKANKQWSIESLASMDYCAKLFFFFSFASQIESVAEKKKSKLSFIMAQKKQFCFFLQIECVAKKKKKRTMDTFCRKKSFLISSHKELMQGNSFYYMQFLPRSTKESFSQWPSASSINSFFKTTNSTLLLSDFVDIQRKSFFELLEKGLIEEFSKRNPITNKNLEIFFYPEYYQLIPPEYNPRRSILYSKSYSAKLYVPAQLTDKKLQKSQLKWVLIGNLPLMTKRGHFILNGAPRVIVNQILRSPGIYFQGSLKEIFSEKWSEKPDITYKRFYTDLICLRGTWLRIEIDKNKEIWAQMKSKPTKIPILWFLLAMGLTERIIFKSVINPSRLLANFNTDISRKIIYRYVTNPSDAWKEISNLISPAPQAHSFLNLKKDIASSPLTPPTGGLGEDDSQLKIKNVSSFFSPPSFNGHRKKKENNFYSKAIKAKLRCKKNEYNKNEKLAKLIEVLNQDFSMKRAFFSPTGKKKRIKHRLFLSSNFSDQIILYNIYKRRKKKLGPKQANLKRQTFKKIALNKSVLNKEKKSEKLNNASFPAFIEKTHARAQDLSLKKNKEMKGLISFLTSSEKSKEGRNWIFKKFMNPRTYDLGKQGRLNFNRKLGLAISSYQTTLTAQDVLSATDYLLKLEKGLKNIDDIDHLKNRRVRTAGELLQIQIGIGLIRLEKMIREKLALKIKIDSQIINAKKTFLIEKASKSKSRTPPLFLNLKREGVSLNLKRNQFSKEKFVNKTKTSGIRWPINNRGFIANQKEESGELESPFLASLFAKAPTGKKKRSLKNANVILQRSKDRKSDSLKQPFLKGFLPWPFDFFFASQKKKKGNKIFKIILKLNKKLKTKGGRSSFLQIESEAEKKKANQLKLQKHHLSLAAKKQSKPFFSSLFLNHFLQRPRRGKKSPGAHITHQNQKALPYFATSHRLASFCFFRNEKSYYFGQPFRLFSFFATQKKGKGFPSLSTHLNRNLKRSRLKGGSSEATLAINPSETFTFTKGGKKPVLNNMLSFFNTKPFNGALREFFGSCLTPDHNVLTNKGFIPIQKVTLEHKVATLKNNKELVYVHPTKVHKYDHDGQVYEVDVPGVSLKTTLNHRMYVQLHAGKQIKEHPYALIPASDLLNKKVRYKKDALWTKSDYQFLLPGIPSLSPNENTDLLRNLCSSAPLSNLKDTFKLPSMGSWNHDLKNAIPDKIMPMDAWLVFIGFFISEGWTYNIKSPNSNVEYKVVLSQKKPIQWIQIEKNLTELNIEYYKIPDATGCINYCIFDKQLWTYLRLYSKGVLKKTLPEWVWMLSKRQCKILLNALIAGNETTSSFFKRSRRYCSCSLKLINDVSRLILHAGYAALSHLSEKRYRPQNKTNIIVYDDYNKILLSTNPAWSINVLSISNRLSPFVNTLSDYAFLQIKRPYHPTVRLGHSRNIFLLLNFFLLRKKKKKKKNASIIGSKDPFLIFKRNPQWTFNIKSLPPLLPLNAFLMAKEETGLAGDYFLKHFFFLRKQKEKRTLRIAKAPFKFKWLAKSILNFLKRRLAKSILNFLKRRLAQPFKFKIARYIDRHTKYGTVRTLLALKRLRLFKKKPFKNKIKNRPCLNDHLNRVDDKLVYYKGPVYCLTVPNEVFYVERNGKGVWTGNSQLSQFMDQLNPLAEITHKRRLSSMGPGGVTRDSATLAIRGIHPTHYGRICPIETPEGKNTGLVNSLTTYARANSQGFLESPFFKVYKGQIQKNAGIYYFSAEQEENIKVAAADVSSLSGRIGFLPKSKIPAKIVYGDTITKISRNLVQYIGVSPIQMISIATSLIPFLEHDDANRALMGSNMQRQAVPLIRAERPLVGTGLESRTVSDSGHSVIAKKSGYVAYVSAKKIVIYTIPT